MYFCVFLRREIRKNQANSSTTKQDITKIELEFNDKMNHERENFNRIISDLRRKLGAAEDRYKSLERKLNDKIRDLEDKHGQEKLQVMNPTSFM